MTVNRGVWLAWFLFLAAAAGYAQDKSAFPFVDMSKAQALIDVLTKENETLSAEALQLRKEAADLTAQATSTQKGASDLVPLWKAVKTRYSELATIDADLVDKGLKARSAAQIEKTQA